MEKLDVLRNSRLFENLTPEELEYLASLSDERRYHAGDTVFTEGDVGDALYIVRTGEVDVLRRGKSGEQARIATLNAPEMFGEMSLIDKEYRSATVVARSDVELLHLSNDNLHHFARAFRNGFTLVVINIARVLSARLRETNRKLLVAGARA